MAILRFFHPPCENLHDISTILIEISQKKDWLNSLILWFLSNFVEIIYLLFRIPFSIIIFGERR